MIDILKKYGEVKEQESLKNYTTYKVGGNAKYIVFPNNLDDLVSLIKYLNENNIKHMVLGNGSNTLFSDKLYDGVIIKLTNFKDIKIEGNVVTAGAGVMFPRLVNECVNNNLAGLEWASGIPGTIGGAVWANAGAYKEETFDYLESITCIDPDGNIKEFSAKDIKHSYRYTEFKDILKEYVVVNAILRLKEGTKEESQAIMARRLEKRLATQPLEYPSAGSVFRNPEGDTAGRIIEQDLGLKGKINGGAMISDKHANFIINYNNAKATEIKELMDLVHDSALEKDNIDLILEQELINWE